MRRRLTCSQLDHLHESIELLTLVVQATATIRHPLIDRDGLLLAVGLKRMNLISQIRFLCHP